MRKIKLGQTGLDITQLGFGGIPIQRLTDEEAVAVVARCLDLGVTFIDTANAYTTSEERIGRAIAGRKREDLVIATKTQSRKREGVEEHLKLSLNRLGITYIDLYQFHQVSDQKSLDAILAPNGPMDAVQEAIREGRVRHVGITSHSMDMAKAAIMTDRFETIMFPFNFIANEPAQELIPLAREHDVGFIAMKPMGGGLLENATVAIKYLMQFPDIVLIPGIEKIHEIEEIAAIMAGPPDMTEAERQTMRRITDELGTRFCRRCDYCQPCTEGIAISTVMVMRSFAKRFPPHRFFTERFSSVIDKAEECSDCGECETRCPYDLPIREMIAEQVEWFRDEYRKHCA